ncbi:hypothetical protein FIBSPDRAFT_941202 [Athelia psychrophila]|uniref:Uncharacterized protein n=1 Tax=Athelia psychrophila TaxID=1759441 RepID=A0A167ULA0_9AGAM|nr:hypothetical protein FIBSPDRAFT_941202 [Fibularhizoctonia sp. CBS 109695]
MSNTTGRQESGIGLREFIDIAASLLTVGADFELLWVWLWETMSVTRTPPAYEAAFEFSETAA